MLDSPLVFSNSIAPPISQEFGSRSTRARKVFPTLSGQGCDSPQGHAEEKHSYRAARGHDHKGASDWQGDSANRQSRSEHHFSRNLQLQHTIKIGLLQWLLTVLIVLCLFAVLFGFSRNGVSGITTPQKRAFNALVTLFSVCLSLVVLTALRSYAKLVKWRILASQYRSIHEFELTMHFHSYLEVMQLLYNNIKAFGIRANDVQILCLLSLGLAIGLQTVIALLGLTYSVDADPNITNWAWGNASFLNLSQIAQPSMSSFTYDSMLDVATGAANSYGMVGESINWFNANGYSQPSTNVGEWNSTIFVYFFISVFADYSYLQIPVTASTDRYINATATCAELEILSGGYADATTDLTELTFIDEQQNQRTMDVWGITNLTSIYMSDTSEHTTCGSRCTNVYVLDAGGAANASTHSIATPHLYTCNSSVSTVHGAENCYYPEQCTLSDHLARIYAGAIGFSGQSLSSTSLQFKTYPLGSALTWGGVENQSTSLIREQQIAAFAANAFSGNDLAGDRIVMPDWYPVSGVSLNVQWNYAVAILCVIPVVQLIVLLLVSYAASTTLIKDSGYLAAARLLKPVIEEIGEHGSVMTSKEMAECLDNYQIKYICRKANDIESPNSPGSEELEALYQVDVMLRDVGEAGLYGNEELLVPFCEGKYD